MEISTKLSLRMRSGEGARPRAKGLMEEFKQAFEKNKLFDLGWKCIKHTWSNHHTNENFTKERLDRSIANILWTNLFKNKVVKVLPTRQSEIITLLYLWLIGRTNIEGAGRSY